MVRGFRDHGESLAELKKKLEMVYVGSSQA